MSRFSVVVSTRQASSEAITRYETACVNTVADALARIDRVDWEVQRRGVRKRDPPGGGPR